VKSITGRLLLFLGVSFAVIGCSAPITIVPPPVNGAISLVPVPTITLKFGSSFTSSSTDGLLIDGPLYKWAQFHPAPVANGTSSLKIDTSSTGWWGLYWAGTFVPGSGYQHSLGISYTCGFFCVGGIPKFIFYPPYVTLGAQGSTTQNTSIDLTYLPAGNWTQEWVAIQNAAPSGGVFVGISDVTPGGQATQYCNTPACDAPSSGIVVTIPAGNTRAPFYINAIKSGPTTYTVLTESQGLESDLLIGHIN
jgi:hypothetical protein